MKADHWILKHVNRLYYLVPALFSTLVICVWPYTGRSVTTTIKYVPIALGILIVSSYLVYHLLYERSLRCIKLRYNLLPTILFLMYIIGSLISFIFFGNRITFLAQALVVLGYFYGFILVQGLGIEVTRSLILGLLIISFLPLEIGVALQEWGHGLPHQEFFYILLPFCFFPYLLYRTRLSLLMSLTALLTTLYFSGKNTSYLMGVFNVLALFGVMQYLKDQRNVRRLIFRSIVFSLPVLVIFFIIWYQLYFEGLISTGNLSFRVFLYLDAFNIFIQSPIVGDFFTKTPVHDMTKYFGRFLIEKYRVLPTHSDVLDLLAHGGIIALIIFLKFIHSLYRNFFRNLVKVRDKGLQAFYILLFITSLDLLLIMTFNPVFNIPINGFLAWFYLGVLASFNHLMNRKLKVNNR